MHTRKRRPRSEEEMRAGGAVPAAVWAAVRMFHLELITTLPQSVGREEENSGRIA